MKLTFGDSDILNGDILSVLSVDKVVKLHFKLLHVVLDGGEISGKPNLIEWMTYQMNVCHTSI